MAPVWLNEAYVQLDRAMGTIIIVALMATPLPLILCPVRAALQSGKQSKPRTI